MEKVFSSLDLKQSLVFSIGPLSALIAARFGLKSWIKYNIVVSIVLALILLLRPQILFSYMLNSPAKSYHFFLMSLYACNLINSASSACALLQSKDDAVFYGQLWARVISSSLIIIDNIVSYNEGIHWNYKILCLSGSFYFFNLLINAYYLTQIDKPKGSNPFRDVANCVAKLEHYFLTLVGVTVYAYPDLFVNSITQSNESFRSLVRASGALLLSFGYESLCVKEFIYIADKKKFMESRCASSLIQTVFLLLGLFYYVAFTSERAYFTFLILNLAHFLIVYSGYSATPNDPRSLSAKNK